MTAALSIEPVMAGRPTLIGIGGVAWSGDPSLLYSTLLGSCIAVCLFDPVARKGGINHFFLPEAPYEENDDTRYGNVALPVLINNLCTVGCRKERLQAKVAGGADIVPNIHTFGTDNANFAMAWLAERNITVIETEHGGQLARRVRFHPSSGEWQVTTVDRDPDNGRS